MDVHDLLTNPLRDPLLKNNFDYLDNFLHNRRNKHIHDALCHARTTALRYHVGNVVLKCADMWMFRWMHDCFSSGLEPANNESSSLS